MAKIELKGQTYLCTLQFCPCFIGEPQLTQGHWVPQKHFSPTAKAKRVLLWLIFLAPSPSEDVWQCLILSEKNNTVFVPACSVDFGLLCQPKGVWAEGALVLGFVSFHNCWFSRIRSGSRFLFDCGIIFVYRQPFRSYLNRLKVRNHILKIGKYSALASVRIQCTLISIKSIFY